MPSPSSPSSPLWCCCISWSLVWRRVLGGLAFVNAFNIPFVLAVVHARWLIVNGSVTFNYNNHIFFHGSATLSASASLVMGSILGFLLMHEAQSHYHEQRWFYWTVATLTIIQLISTLPTIFVFAATLPREPSGTGQVMETPMSPTLGVPVAMATVQPERVNHGLDYRTHHLALFDRDTVLYAHGYAEAIRERAEADVETALFVGASRFATRFAPEYVRGRAIETQLMEPGQSGAWLESPRMVDIGALQIHSL